MKHWRELRVRELDRSDTGTNGTVHERSNLSRGLVPIASPRHFVVSCTRVLKTKVTGTTISPRRRMRKKLNLIPRRDWGERGRGWTCKKGEATKIFPSCLFLNTHTRSFIIRMIMTFNYNLCNVYPASSNVEITVESYVIDLARSSEKSTDELDEVFIKYKRNIMQPKYLIDVLCKARSHAMSPATCIH